MELQDRIKIHERLATIESVQKQQNEKLDQILAHVQKTNGRVTRLETWRTVMKSNIALIAAISSVVVSGLFTLLIKLL